MTQLNSREKTSLTILFLTACLNLFFYEGYAFVMPEWVKVLNGLSFYSSAYFILTSGNNNFQKLSRTAKVLILIMAVLAVISIGRGIFITDAHLEGNHFKTLFFNPICAPIFFFLIYISYNTPSTIVFLRDLIIYLALFTSLLFFVGIYADLRIILPLCLFFPVCNKKQKIVALMVTSICFWCNFINSTIYTGSTRKFIICIVFGIIAYFLVYVIKNRLINWLFAFCLLLSPYIIVATTIFAQNEDSIFILLKNQWPFEDSGNLRNDDTRTFLYEEVAFDLTKNEAWILGKSAYSSYHSYFFKRMSDADSDNRIVVEVTFLHYTLKGGLAFSIPMLILLLFASFMSLKHSKNKWLKYLAINFLGFYLNMFIGDSNFYDIVVVAFWMCVGLCLNSQWLEYSDKDISDIFEKSSGNLGISKAYETYLRRKEMLSNRDF